MNGDGCEEDTGGYDHSFGQTFWIVFALWLAFSSISFFLLNPSPVLPSNLFNT